MAREPEEELQQIPGIGQVIARGLVEAGISTTADLASANVEELARMVGYSRAREFIATAKERMKRVPEAIVEERAPEAVVEEVPEAIVEERAPEAVVEEMPEAIVEGRVPEAVVEEVPEAIVEERVREEVNDATTGREGAGTVT